MPLVLRQGAQRRCCWQGLKSREIGGGGGRGGRGELGEGGKGAGLYFLPCSPLIIMEGGWLIFSALFSFIIMEGGGLYFLPCSPLIIMEGGWLIFSALFSCNNYMSL